MDGNLPRDLVAEWKALKAEDPKLRIRDAAGKMGVSEGELVAADVGPLVTRLRPEWEAYFKALPALGEIMSLTRNEYAVHEKVGTFDRIMWNDERPVVLDPNINLRINIRPWTHLFAVVEPHPERDRRSLQAFDATGTAIHKVHLRGVSDVAAFDALVERFRAADQSAGMTTQPAREMPTKADSEIDVAQLETEWAEMSDTHDVFALARKFGISRVQMFGLVRDELAERIDNDAFSRMLTTAAAEGEEVMIFVGSPGLVQIHIGPVKRVERRGPWNNVLDPGFDLHLKEGGIASTWIIRKPTKDGPVTSIEIFDERGGQIAWIFGKRKPGNPQLPTWAPLVERVARAG